MAVISISRQYGSGGTEIAARVGALLGYQYFDKRVMAQVATEMGLSEAEMVDLSEDTYKARGLLDRLMGRVGSRTVAQVGTWKEDATGIRTREVAVLDEAQSIAMLQGIIRAAYRQGNFVIVGRGGQAILQGKRDVLHVRIIAPVEARTQRVVERENISFSAARDLLVKRDQTAADYLTRFYNVDWSDPLLYDLVINTSKFGTDAAAQLIANAVSYLPAVERSA